MTPDTKKEEKDKRLDKETEKVAKALIDLLLFALLGAFFWPLAINPWLVYFGKTAKVVWWHGVILGMLDCTRKWSIMAAITTTFALYLLED